MIRTILSFLRKISSSIGVLRRTITSLCRISFRYSVHKSTYAWSALTAPNDRQKEIHPNAKLIFYEFLTFIWAPFQSRYMFPNIARPTPIRRVRRILRYPSDRSTFFSPHVPRRPQPRKPIYFTRYAANKLANTLTKPNVGE